jgi:diamine N-acetyltransferase
MKEKVLNKLSIRSIKASDLDFLIQIENNPISWEVSNVREPFSKEVLKQYVAEPQDIYRDKQLRLVLEEEGKQLGFIDFFEFDDFHERAGIGLVISPESQGKGYGTIGLQMALKFAKNELALHTLQAHILEDNKTSIFVFEKVGFTKCGELKNWHLAPNGERKNTLVFQIELLQRKRVSSSFSRT